MTIKRIISLLEIEKECVLRNAEHRCNRDCDNCDLCQIDTDLLEMYTEAIWYMRNLEGAQWKRC